jgi:hypothetical protein
MTQAEERPASTCARARGAVLDLLGIPYVYITVCVVCRVRFVVSLVCLLSSHVSLSLSVVFVFVSSVSLLGERRTPAKWEA